MEINCTLTMYVLYMLLLSMIPLYYKWSKKGSITIAIFIVLMGSGIVGMNI